jgi:glycosyl hydrolase family 113
MLRCVRRAVVGLAIVIAVAAVVARRRAPARPPERVQLGVALGLFASDPEWDYGGMIDEIAALGATDVAIDVVWDQGPLAATSVEPRDGVSPSLATLRRTLAQAHRAHLRVLLFPILHVAAAQPGEWRGRIAFADPHSQAAWWASYGRFVATMATIAEEAHVERLSIGSELVQLEPERARWAALIDEVRRRYHGRLVYSANWDHFSSVSFWDLVDEIGVTGYFELTAAPAPERAQLEAAWRAQLPRLRAFAAERRRGLVLTEIGYPSQRGANTRPWDQERAEPLDLEEQRLCYAAFLATVADEPFVDGIYMWNWFGVGGPNDAGYTPRGKPAAEVLRAWLRGRRGAP